ncbi:twin-arginine translocase subunit TatC [Chloroflexi bacterium TSY]|nr:twin-arginine translocase subunit TatC [Chloroflexi bacterium TSY]
MSQHVDALDPIDESQMTLMEHLIELRMRLMWISGAVLVGTLVSMIFANAITAYMAGPVYAVGNRLIDITPTGSLIIFFKISFTAGTVIAMPIIVYQTIAYVAPGLYPHEKRAVFISMPGVLLLFLCGAAFAFYIMLPVAVQFLTDFMSSIEKEWAIDRYYGFVTRVVFWIGVAFEMPLILSILARIGLVSGIQLAKFWRQAIVINAILAAIITPTIDPVNMAIVMAPLLVLYALSVGLAYLLYKPREPRDFSD